MNDNYHFGPNGQRRLGGGVSGFSAEQEAPEHVHPRTAHAVINDLYMLPDWIAVAQKEFNEVKLAHEAMLAAVCLEAGTLLVFGSKDEPRAAKNESEREAAITMAINDNAYYKTIVTDYQAAKTELERLTRQFEAAKLAAQLLAKL